MNAALSILVLKRGRRARYVFAGAALLVVVGLVGWRTAISLRADHHLHEARKALEKERIDEARQHLARCLELRPDRGEVQYLAARTARRAGAIEEAQAHLQRSKELGWDTKALALEGVLLAAQRDPRLYEEYLFDSLRRDHPDRNLILEAFARGYLGLLELPKALHCLDLWLERDGDAIQALNWRGDVRERLGEFEQAQADFRRVVTLDPEQDQARIRLARLLLRKRQLQEAAEHFELAHQHRPEDVEVLRGLARCRAEQDRREEAEQLLDRALALQPDDVLTLTQRGCLALEAGHLAAADNALRRAVTLAPFEREPLFNFSRCLQAQGKQQEAQQWQERLAQVEADLTLVKKLMAQALAAPGDPNPRRELGIIFLRNHQEKEGLRWLGSALQCDPRHSLTHQVLADYFEKQGSAELASRHRQFAQPRPDE
jgi:Tfp pilus assembly protein PilF